jgi:hypothetical protein
MAFRSDESGGKHAAVQTLRAGGGVRWSRQRLECGDFSTALMLVPLMKKVTPTAAPPADAH